MIPANPYRNANSIQALAAAMPHPVRPVSIMEICGGQTHAIMRYGLDKLLPDTVSLIHGPGCPVCVTPESTLDQAIQLAQQPGITLCTFADMLRVPALNSSLQRANAAGAKVVTITTPLTAVKLAKNTTDQVVLFAVGFETTAPTYALTLHQAKLLQLNNFSVLLSMVSVPPAIKALLSHQDHRIDGFLAAGHVCAVSGYADYLPLAQQYQTPIVITGFEPVDLLRGIKHCLEQIEREHYTVTNRYARAVQKQGNLTAQRWVEQVFQTSDVEWRGLGTLTNSGFTLTPAYQMFDAQQRFAALLKAEQPGPSSHQAKPKVTDLCLASDILQGRRKPSECPLFGNQCLPTSPAGAPMVSEEGACAAYYRFARSGT